MVSLQLAAAALRADPGPRGWRPNAEKGRNCPAVVLATKVKVGHWYESYADTETGTPLQAKLWLMGQPGSRDDTSFVVPCTADGIMLTKEELMARITRA